MQTGNYSITPTVQDVDAELRDSSDSLVERYAAKFDQAQISSKRWDVLPTEQRYAMRAQNELARRQNEAARLKAKQAEEKRIQAQEDAAAAAKIEVFKRQAAAAFPGTAAEFESAWPAIKSAWQQQTVLDQLSNDVMEQKRRALRGAF